MLMPVRSPGEPVADQARPVARRVVHDDMYDEACWDVVLHFIEGFAKLLCAMARHAFADDATGLHMRLCRHRRDKTCEQRCGAMTLLVMRAPLHLPGAHRQQRPGAVARLDLAFLIDADDQCLVRRIQ